MGKLTAKKTESLSVPGTYEDGGGLRLVVKRSGAKSWVLRYQLSGKRREMGLGSYPSVSLRDARIAANTLIALRTSGIDPLEERKAQREAQEAAILAEQSKSETFDELAAAYIAAHRAGWKSQKHAQQWENTLKTYASPVLGKLSASEITTAHVLKVLNHKDFWSLKPETASRVRNRIELVLDAAKARGLREGENPARWRGHLDKLLPQRQKIQAVRHHPALPYPELPAFMSQLDTQDTTTLAMRMTILTACRTSEVLGATWNEIDLEGRTWTIPAQRMKAHKEHRVPLAVPVVKLIQALPRVEGNPHLFPGMRPGQPLSNMAMLMALRRLERDDLTMHGFRSTFRDWAAECTHYPREVCEMALAHVVASGSESAYWRGDLFEKRRQLMQDWAAYATGVPVKLAHTVSLKKHKAG